MSPGGTEGAEGDCMPGTSGQPCGGRSGQGYRQLVTGYLLDKYIPIYPWTILALYIFIIFMNPCVKCS